VSRSPHLPRSAAQVDLRVVASAGSTNDVLRGLADAAHLTTVVTLDQTAGRGRLGRVWTAPPGQALAVSVLVDAGVPVDRLGLLPLAAGVAMADAVRAALPAGRVVDVKWPNDVLVDGRKASGVLTELAGSGAIVGAGVNLAIPEDALPTPTSTSLVLAGATANGDELADAVLSAYLAGLASLVPGLVASAPASGVADVRARIRDACGTLGRDVRVELPGGDVLRGRAVDLQPDGRLVVAPVGGGRHVAVTAGDVTHLRHEGRV